MKTTNNSASQNEDKSEGVKKTQKKNQAEEAWKETLTTSKPVGVEDVAEDSSQENQQSGTKDQSGKTKKKNLPGFGPDGRFYSSGVPTDIKIKARKGEEYTVNGDKKKTALRTYCLNDSTDIVVTDLVVTSGKRQSFTPTLFIKKFHSKNDNPISVSLRLNEVLLLETIVKKIVEQNKDYLAQHGIKPSELAKKKEEDNSEESDIDPEAPTEVEDEEEEPPQHKKKMFKKNKEAKKKW